VRDAQGNTIAVYTVGNNNVNTGKATLTEQHLYGSRRLGILNRSLDVSNTTLLFKVYQLYKGYVCQSATA
jgi:hypothetical protein